MQQFIKPADIEKQSFAIIQRELCNRTFPPGTETIIYRVIHASADFEYADNLVFSKNAVQRGLDALQSGATIITDTNMTLAGINQKALQSLGGQVICFMSDETVAQEARNRGVTRAVVSMERAANLEGALIFAIGNAPTALLRLQELIQEKKVTPSLVIGVPVGFVNVIESKESFLTKTTPYIIAKGRKGGSTIAAAIINALLYQCYQREGF